MAFPDDVLPLVVELNLDGTWTDITSYVQRRDLIDITRGRSDEGTRVDRSMARMTLNNRDGRFSSRNPTGAYYGTIGRNTPIRIAVEHGDTYLRIEEDDDRIATEDKATLDITGDLDIRIDLTLENWRETSNLAAKYGPAGQRSWIFFLDDEGTLSFRHSADGTATLNKVSTDYLPIPGNGRQALRVTLDVNNGASGHTVTFYYSDSIDGPWTQLGDALVTAGTTSVFASTADLEVGDIPQFPIAPPRGKIHAFQLRNGINGTVVANPDFSAQTPGATSFADTASTPNTWTVQDGAELTNRRYRFHGEVSSWPQRWDPTGTDIYTPIEAAGIIRRLTQGASPLQSTLYRGLANLTSNTPVAYWPCEDGEGSTSIASGLADGLPMTITGVLPDFGAYTGFDASAPLPVIRDSVWTGQVPAYPVTGEATIRFLLAVPPGGISGDQAILTIYCSGTAPVWTIRYGDPGGDLKVQAHDEDGAVLLDSGFIPFEVDGKKLRVALDLEQNGSNVEWDLSILTPGSNTGFTAGGTLNNRTVGQVKKVTANLGGGLGDTAIGHISVQPSITSIFDLGAQLSGYAGERAALRIERLCNEEGIPFRCRGENNASVRMGPQRQATLIDLLHECAEADEGMLYEPRTVLGIGYRTGAYLRNQSAAVALDYARNDLAESLEPVDDDQSTRNDITVTRRGGSSSRIVQETGPLSVSDPPDGVGRYDDAVTVNVQYDEQTADHASWKVHLGTVDEARYPTVTVNLARTQITGNAALASDLHDADVGDRLTITNLPSFLPPEDVSQLIQGYSETLGNYEHEITFNCSPESPYQTAVYGTSRYAPEDTVTNEPLDATETSVDITTPTGPLWDTNASGFDIMIGGERMTVTAVGAATGTVQTLTVVRSVNGVVKSHATGLPVEFVNKPVRSLPNRDTLRRTIIDGDTVQSIDTPRTVMAQDDTPQLNLTSSSYVPGSPEVGVYFIAPTSGRVLVTVGGGARDNTNDNRVFLSPQIFQDDVNGSVVLAPSVTFYGYGTPGSNADYVFGSRTSMIENLSPGRRYYARVMMAAEQGTGSTADVAVREIMVEPTS
jgi:hypothetical protein